MIEEALVMTHVELDEIRSKEKELKNYLKKYLKRYDLDDKLMSDIEKNIFLYGYGSERIVQLPNDLNNIYNPIKNSDQYVSYHIIIQKNTLSGKSEKLANISLQLSDYINIIADPSFLSAVSYVSINNINDVKLYYIMGIIVLLIKIKKCATVDIDKDECRILLAISQLKTEGKIVNLKNIHKEIAKDKRLANMKLGDVKISIKKLENIDAIKIINGKNGDELENYGKN